MTLCGDTILAFGIDYGYPAVVAAGIVLAIVHEL